MKIAIIGSNGFLGRALTRQFENNHEVIGVIRQNTADTLQWNGQNLLHLKEDLNGLDVIFNLCGRSVDCRYTEANKNEILRSRTDSTRAVAELIAVLNEKPTVWINASSATIYIHSENIPMTEANGILGDDFSMNICKQWENEMFKHTFPEIRQVALRTSIVLGDNGGAFTKLANMTRLGLGGRQGEGNQMVSWIHITDFCRALNHIIHDTRMDGPINVTAPKPLSNTNFMKQMRSALGKAFGIGTPKLLLEIGAWLIRTETELILKSRNVIPEKLLAHGFKFTFPGLQEAIEDLV